MAHYFREELRRAVLSRNTLVTGTLIILCLFLGSAEFIFNRYPGVNAMYLFLFAHSKGTSSILNLLFPIIVSIPFAASYVQDVRSGFASYIFLRTSKMKYAVTRLVVNGMVSSGIVIVCMLGMYILFLLLTGFDIGYTESVSITMFNEFYKESPVLYVFFLILNSGLCAIVFSTLGLGISTLIRNQYITLVVPFVYYLLSGTVLIQINKYFNSAMLYDVNFYPENNYVNILVYDAVLLLIGIILFLLGVRKHE